MGCQPAGGARGKTMSKAITIYHNPKCSNSRNALEMIREAGHEPTVVEYLKSGWTKPLLQDLLKKMKVGPRDILREKEPLVAELGLADASEAALLAAMVEHPVLVNRPIVVTPKGAKLCRPAVEVKSLL